jgi:hypothetical protein
MKGWVTAFVWLVVVLGSLYFPFIRSPEMTNSQLMLNYWWFYLPAFCCIVALTIFNHKPRGRR